MSDSYRPPRPAELSELAELFPSLRGLPGVRPWEPPVLARAVWRWFHTPEPTPSCAFDPSGQAACALAILLRLDETRYEGLDGRPDEQVEFFRREVDPVSASGWWDDDHWQAFVAIPLRWRKIEP